MKILVTGSAGHLGEALARTLESSSHHVVGIDVLKSEFTSNVGSIADCELVKRCMSGVAAVLHAAYDDANVKANEFLYRRVDLEDVVTAHLLAMEKAPSIGFGRYIVSATTPFTPDDLHELRIDAPLVVKRRFPDYEDEYARRGWKMFPSIGRVYVNERARKDLEWRPRYDFRYVLDRLKERVDPRSPLSRAVGSKGYHRDRRYPVE